MTTDRFSLVAGHPPLCLFMHRFYLPPERCSENTLRLDGREAHHAAHVLRLKRGEQAVVLGGTGQEYLCEVEKVSHEAVELRMTKKISNPPPPCEITLLQALPKGKIIESIIQKSVELGVHRVVPLLTERVIAHLDDKCAEDKREKWQQVAIEAIKQCGAAWLPKIETPTTIEKFLGRKEKHDLAFVGSLQKKRRHPREIFREFQKVSGHLPKSAAVWIGPEGDFTSGELKTIEASGVFPVTLGNLTLRVETAAVYCLSILNYELSQ